MAKNRQVPNDNPFYTTITIPNEYFCDREMETAKMISLLTNGNNIVLKAQRRIGKSSLILHLFEQPEIKRHYNTIRVDLYKTVNEADFVKELGSSLLDAPFAREQKVKKTIMEAIPEIKVYAKLNLGPVSAGVETALRQQYEETISRIFKYLENTKKPNIVVFDEFQAIEDYPEKMPELLRSYIQKMNNTKFIFSGSEKHILASMFNEDSKPFYKSALPMELQIIPRVTYSEFCKRLVERKGRRIESQATDLVYDLFLANTFDMQQVLNVAYSVTLKGSAITTDTVKDAIDYILYDNDTYYRELLAQCATEKERNLLQCLAVEGLASKWGASSIQSSLKKMTDKNKKVIIIRVGQHSYRLEDKFFELWLSQQIGILEKKYDEAGQLFKEVMEATEQLPKMARLGF